MNDIVSMSAHESLEILTSTPRRLEVRAQYQPHGTPPPRHLHPDQTETFEVTSGELHVEIAGAQRKVSAGEHFVVPPGTVHRMWNAGGVPAEANWITEPRLRTEEWLRGLDALNRPGRDGPDVLGFAAHAATHRDVFRPVLIAGSPRLSRVVIAALGAVGKLLGRQPRL